MEDCKHYIESNFVGLVNRCYWDNSWKERQSDALQLEPNCSGRTKI